jgi:polysaccharide pyruvyl transferase WcaK-like protein
VTRDRNLVVLAPRGGQPQATDRLLELGRQLRSRGRRVLALGLQPGTDAPETQRLAEVADAGILETGDPNAVSGAVAGAGAVVGVRLHALILAAGAETPFVGVSYDPKVAAFCQDAGASHHGVDFPVAEVLASLSGKPRVDWQAVQAMRERSRASFLEALGG